MKRLLVLVLIGLFVLSGTADAKRNGLRTACGVLESGQHTYGEVTQSIGPGENQWTPPRSDIALVKATAGPKWAKSIRRAAGLNRLLRYCNGKYPGEWRR